jgi:hypothetical protein
MTICYACGNTDSWIGVLEPTPSVLLKTTQSIKAKNMKIGRSILLESVNTVVNEGDTLIYQGDWAIGHIEQSKDSTKSILIVADSIYSANGSIYVLKGKIHWEAKSEIYPKGKQFEAEIN